MISNKPVLLCRIKIQSTCWFCICQSEVALNIPYATENSSNKTVFRSNKSRHCAYIIYSVKTRFFKRDMLLYTLLQYIYVCLRICFIFYCFEEKQVFVFLRNESFLPKKMIHSFAQRIDTYSYFMVLPDNYQNKLPNNYVEESPWKVGQNYI